MLDKLLEEIEELKQAKELLEEIWHEVGPYSEEDDLKRIQKVRGKLRDHFNFDDSE